MYPRTQAGLAERQITRSDVGSGGLSLPTMGDYAVAQVAQVIHPDHLHASQVPHQARGQLGNQLPVRHSSTAGVAV